VASWGLDGEGPMQRKHVLPSIGESEWSPLCEPEPTYNPANGTLIRKVVSGPEDPKLLALPQVSSNPRWAITFSSLPPVSTRTGCYRAGLPQYTEGTAGVPQMYIAPDVRADFSPGGAGPSEPVVGMRLECGEEFKPEKNWIGFTHEGQLHYVYQIHPNHEVVQARSSTGECSSVYTSRSYAPLAELADAGYKLHGSATAVPYNGTNLALLHTVDAQGRYATMAYRFELKPPFAILAVSRPLPLQGLGDLNFASGLLAPEGSGKVIISYGEQDAASRALVMSTAFFDSLFE